jgi:hypothetical protein
MALLQSQITLTAGVAQKMCQARTARRGLIIKNHDAANPLELGGSTVTATGAAGGYQLKSNDSLVLTDNNATIQCEEWWAISAAGGVVSVVEQIY